MALAIAVLGISDWRNYLTAEDLQEINALPDRIGATCVRLIWYYSGRRREQLRYYLQRYVHEMRMPT